MADAPEPIKASIEDMPALETERPRARIGRVVLHSWPKVIMMFPTLILALVCGTIMAFNPVTAPPETFQAIHLVGLIFMLVLAINLVMLLYDLTLGGFLIVVLTILATVLGLFLLSRMTDVWGAIGRALSVRIYANAAFYYMFAIVLALNFVIAYIITRFNYWVVESNEIIIHRGFMHEQERHPTAQARFKLVIDDIVEYGILGSGKLVFTFGDDGSVQELPTVLFVRSKAKRLDELLGRVAVIAT